jgi:RNA binding activity-knot of a chromodomain
MAATSPPPQQECPPTPPPPEVVPQQQQQQQQPVLAKPLNIGDHCQVFCAAGNQQLAAVIIERRPSRVCHIHNKNTQHPGTTASTVTTKRKRTVDVATLAPDDVEYYIHYVEHDRWVVSKDWIFS